MELEIGKLYQVKQYGKGWVIAEYVRTVEAHTERYFNLGSNVERSRKVGTRSYWKPLVGGMTFASEVEAGYVRPVTAETLTEIARLQADIKRLSEEQRAVIRELRELTQ